MTPLYLFIALILQTTHILCDEEVTSAEATATSTVESSPIVLPLESREALASPDVDHASPDMHAAGLEFLDMFFGAGKHLQPGSSAAMMAHVTNSDKGPEEQLEDIKEMACEITKAIHCEMANLLSFALANCDDHLEKNARKKRSLETPMGSTELVMRLLKHIKSSNDYQNIAIEKMMTAQEIANKFGIEFNPDPEILTDMAVAANDQANELTNILKDSVSLKNQTEEVTFVPVQNETANDQSYYVYAVQPELQIQPIVEFIPEPSHHHHHHHHRQPETQIVPPPTHHHQVPPPVSQRPVYGPPMPQPSMDYFPQSYPFEPVTTTTTYYFPIEEYMEPEPELVGEEYEETVSSKVYVDHEDAGSSTVNHVMTYTLSEKAHFRTPQVESLPQQMQYYFFM